MTDVEIITLAIAGYAAIVSTLAVGAQAAALLLSWRTRIEVNVSARQLMTVGQEPEPVVMVELVNHGDWPVKISSVAVMPQKRLARWRRNLTWLAIAQPFPVEEPLPIQVPAHDAKLIWIKPEAISDRRDIEKGVRVQVATTTGKAFRSKRTPLRFD
jgi:hypothetical protein